MKVLKDIFVVAAVATVVYSSYAGNWVYTITSGEAPAATSGTITDGAWTFRASVAKNSTNMTVSTPVDDIEPSQCPSEITDLDFSREVVDAVDSDVKYTIVKLDPVFHPRGGAKRNSADYVGELTLPGEGLQTISDTEGAFCDCANMTGDLVFPTTLTKVNGLAFSGTKITSADFKMATATLNGNYQRGAFYNCKSLKWVRFDKDGSFVIGNNSHSFESCSAMVDADLSGVIKVTASKKSYALLNGCSALTNVTLSSSLCVTNTTTNPGSEGTVGNAIFNGTYNNLNTIRFTGAAPKELPYWIEGDGGFLGVFANTKSITTIIPAEFRNIKNENGMSWEDYSAEGTLNIADSTWKAEYVKEGVDLSKRKLLLDKVPEDEAPTISDPTVSDIWTNSVTVTVDGGGLRGGTISVSLTNSLGVVSGPLAVADFGDSCTFDNLSPNEEYTVIVIAENDKGVSTNDTTVFRTVGVCSLAARAVYTDADKTLTFYYDMIDRTSLGTTYEIGDGSGSTWAADLKSVLKYVVFAPEFRDFRPTSCAEWFNQCSAIVSFEGLEFLDTSEVKSMYFMFRGVSNPKSIDLSTFRTPKLVNCERMFYYAGGLTNILANENFINRYVTSGGSMFDGCKKLVGGNGSTVDELGDSSAWARVDFADYPGLFTYKDPVITAKPTVLEHRLHGYTTEGVSIRLTGMDLGSTGVIELTVHPADDPTAVAATFYPPTYCDYALTGLDAGTSYILDVEVRNSVGTTKLDPMAFKTKRVSPPGHTPKLVFDDDNLTATFYFDDLPHTGFGAENVYEVSNTGRTWLAHSTWATVTNVVFDASFENYYPVSCRNWFYGCPKVKNIQNIEYLNTEDVTDFEGMFRQASALKHVDLSHFNTSSATTMNEMFRNATMTEIDLSNFDVTQVTSFNSMFTGSTSLKTIDISTWDCSGKKPDGRNMFKDCLNLTTIYAGENFVLGRGDTMFSGAVKLVGGKGTAYDANFTGLTYARLDGGPDSDTPGYFTEKRAVVARGMIIIFR